MEKRTKCYGIIPSRYGSTRFKGKALADILGKPMFWHVYTRALQCEDLDDLILATDDERIFNAAKGFDFHVTMTDTRHHSGTDRVLEAAEQLKAAADDTIINIQGDEPVLNPKMLSQLIHPFKDPKVQVTTLAHPISSTAAKDPNQVKVTRNTLSNAIYFSRSPIPFSMEKGGENFLGHIGMYGFRMSALRAFSSLSPSTLEKMERLEQLRLIENEIPIHVVLTEFSSIGVDQPEDIRRVIKILKK